MKKIIRNTNVFDQLINSCKQKSPYFPDYIYDYSIDLIEKRLIKAKFFTIVRHKHEGVWYKRHHFKSFEEPLNNIEEQIHSFTKDFLFDIYLDLSFGVINPNLAIDDVDEIQLNELERLNIK